MAPQFGRIQVCKHYLDELLKRGEPFDDPKARRAFNSSFYEKLGAAGQEQKNVVLYVSHFFKNIATGVITGWAASCPEYQRKFNNAVAIYGKPQEDSEEEDGGNKENRENDVQMEKENQEEAEEQQVNENNGQEEGALEREEPPAARPSRAKPTKGASRGRTPKDRTPRARTPRTRTTRAPTPDVEEVEEAEVEAEDDENVEPIDVGAELLNMMKEYLASQIRMENRLVEALNSDTALPPVLTLFPAPVSQLLPGIPPSTGSKRGLVRGGDPLKEKRPCPE